MSDQELGRGLEEWLFVVVNVVQLVGSIFGVIPLVAGLVSNLPRRIQCGRVQVKHEAVDIDAVRRRLPKEEDVLVVARHLERSGGDNIRRGVPIIQRGGEVLMILKPRRDRWIRLKIWEHERPW